MDLSGLIRNVPDFPTPGIGFKDITTLIRDADGFKFTIDLMAKKLTGIGVDMVIGVESRGFIFGGALAYKLDKGFNVIRKPGKLPAETISESYELEYGIDKIEIHKDAVSNGDRVLLVDDLLATGGTMEAAVRLVEKLGADVTAIVFVVELGFLNGRSKLDGKNIISLINYESE